jgi:dTDP-4-dehydrorhamnose reductase
MKVLILGSTGLLGQALVQEAIKRKCEVIGAARTRADLCFDVAEKQALEQQITSVNPDVVINTVAIVSLDFCETNPDRAYLINSRPSGIIARLGRQMGFQSIQISTDHYFTGDKDTQHSESSPVSLLNEYARTKYAAEALTLSYANSLVLRTNIVGFRGKTSEKTFVEWIVDNLANSTPMTLFDDFFTSSIDVCQFSRSCFDLIEKKTIGVLNLASREVVSKKRFIESLASQLGYEPQAYAIGSIRDMPGVWRAESIGLDVRKAENILGYRLPTQAQVTRNLVQQYKERIK